MSTYIDNYDHPIDVGTRQRRSFVAWLLWFLAMFGLSAFLGLVMVKRGPNLSVLAWLVYLAGVLVIFYRPRYGLYLIIFLVLIGDNYLTPWYPFTKNFSSRESLLYLHDTLIISPLESYFALIFISWLGRGAMQRKMKFYVSELFLPAMIFLGFILFGLFYGVSTGGNLNIALWESRPIFYLVAMLVLTNNLIETRRQASNLLWTAMLALLVESLIGDYYFLVTLRGSLQGVEAITEHAAAIHMNTLFVFVAASWLYKASAVKRFVLPLMVPIVFLTYLATQRRAAFLTLAIALVMMAIILFLENRRAFWLIVPPLGLAAMVYIAIFWNASGALGLPAQAVKSVVAQDQADAADLSSNLYRQIENVNTSFTVHQRPLTGVGFGQKFYVIVPLPDISFFSWWQYFPHNSIIWIWLKAGVGGFIAMLFLVGMAIMVGARALWRMPRDDMSAIVLTAVLYIVMHFIFAYADISWDIQSMVYVGMMMGLLSAAEHIVGQPVPAKQTRWPWQPGPEPAPGLRPFPPPSSNTK
ncbi:MAG: O-antigen ligase family protein [Chloroflexi bacterium]|nr:O-antigen ligase family protein [Chloroflexota bacterium]